MQSLALQSFWRKFNVVVLSSGLLFAPTFATLLSSDQAWGDGDTVANVAHSTGVVSNEIQLLITAREAMQARVDLVMDGQPHNFDVSTYTLKDDNVGVALLAAAVENVRRGGRSRIAFDAYESKVSPEILEYVVAQGVEVKIFRPVVSDITRPLDTARSWAGINNRNHQKVLIVDHAYAAIGSSNLSTDYYLGARNRESRHEWKFKDRELMIHGPAVSDIQNKFDRDWASENFKPITVGNKTNPVEWAARSSEWALKIETMTGQLEAMKNTKEFVNPVVRTDQPVVYQADSLNYLSKSRDVHNGIINLIDSAQSTLVMENPYIVLPEDFFRAVERARKRGVRVSLYTNDPNGTDGGDVGAASVPDFERLAKIGVEINFYDLTYVFHGKTIAADAERFFWGSYNFDSRSKRFNLENGLFFTSPEIFRQLTQRRNQEGFRQQMVSVRGNVLQVEPMIRTCEEVFALVPKSYSTQLDLKLRLKRPFL